jgi:hypothetical protein
MEKRIPLFRRTLGVRYEALAPEIRAVHDVTQAHRVHGRCDIARGGNLLSKFAGWLVRAPRKAQNQPFFIDITPEKTGERWVRDYNGKQTVSTVRPYSKRRSGIIKEHFGLVSILFALKPSAGRLAYDVKSVRFLGIPLPFFLRPRIQMQEIAEERQCRFDISVTLPLGGRMMRMTGWLVPADSPKQEHVIGQRDEAEPAGRGHAEDTADTGREDAAGRKTQPITQRNRRAVPPVGDDHDAAEPAPSQRAPRPADAEAQTVPIRTENRRHVPQAPADDLPDRDRSAPDAAPDGAPDAAAANSGPTPSQQAPRPADMGEPTVPNRPENRRKTPTVAPEEPEPQARPQANQQTRSEPRAAGEDDPSERRTQRRTPQKRTRLQR